MLKKRGMTLQKIAAIVHPRRHESPDAATIRAYLPHISRTINGTLPIRNPDGHLNPTWCAIKRVLTPEEFESALTHAEKRKTRTKELTPAQPCATMQPL